MWCSVKCRYVEEKVIVETRLPPSRLGTLIVRRLHSLLCCLQLLLISPHCALRACDKEWRDLFQLDSHYARPHATAPLPSPYSKPLTRRLEESAGARRILDDPPTSHT